MLCLGIEGTAHTFGAGIVDEKCRVLSNVNSVFTPESGGIHPRDAANHHVDVALNMIKNALSRAKVNIRDIQLVAFSQGPGLGPCLRTAATVARAISLSRKIPVIGVNHCIAHLEIGRKICNCSLPIMLYVSGGNTQVTAYSNGRYRVFGETQDIGVGNMLDKFGWRNGLTFPCGPKIEELARNGKKYISLPYSVKGMDVAFSGIMTAAQQLKNKGERMEDICFSIQETVFAMLTEVTERAMAHIGREEILLSGGVARNKRLQEMLKCMSKERVARFFVPPPELCVDNGAMIAWTGILMHESGIKMRVKDTEIKQRYRTDEVDVKWIGH